MNPSDLPEPIRERLKLNYWLQRANVPRNMWSLDWGRFEGVEGLEEVAEVAFDVCDAWVNEDSYRGIALFGRPGRGKTTVVATALCNLIYATIPRDTFGLLSAQPSGYFITLADYQALYLRSIELQRWVDRSAPGQGDAAEYHRIFRLLDFIDNVVPHLVLDDVGQEHHTWSGSVQDRFHALIRGRFAAGLSTSITSNLKREEWENVYGAAQFSFLHEACEVVSVLGDDFRTKAATERAKRRRAQKRWR